MGELEERAEPAGLVPQTLELVDRVIGGADHGAARLDHRLGRRLRAEVVARCGRVDGGEVVGPFLQPVVDVGERFLPGLGDVDRPDHAPSTAVHRPSFVGRGIVGDLPVGPEGVVPRGHGGSDAEQSEVMCPGELGGVRCDRRRDGDFRVRVRVRAQLAGGVRQVEPVGSFGHGLAVEQPQDDLEALLHAVSLCRHRDPEHRRIGRQQSGPDTEHDASLGLVIELDDAVRDHQGVVVRQRHHAGAESDALGSFGSGGDEQLGAGDDLVARRVVFADPCLGVSESVEVFHQFEVALDGQRRVLVDGVERCQEDAVVHSRSTDGCVAHSGPPQISDWCGYLTERSSF